MASYGVFLAACGFEYNGPHGHLGFAPRLEAGNFRAPFTAAEGWGTLSQKIEGKTQQAGVEVKWGRLKLKSLALALPKDAAPVTLRVSVGGQPVDAKHELKDGRLRITLGREVLLTPGKKLEVAIG